MQKIEPPLTQPAKSLREPEITFGLDSRQQIREYAQTFAAEFLVMACQILVYKQAAHYLGKIGFSEYAVARRTASLLYPVTLLGLGVALPRYIGHAAGSRDPERATRYYAATVQCVTFAGLLLLLLVNLFQTHVAFLFFGNKNYRDLMFPLSLFMFGLSLHALAYSYFRGNLLMRRANSLQFVNLGIVPLASFFFFGTSMRQVLMALGLLTIGVAIIGLLFTPWKEAAQQNSQEARELLHYGLQRVPGDFVHMALLSLPATLVAHLSGVQAAGSVAFGVSILSMISALFTPFGLILLPKASGMLARGGQAELREHVSLLVKISLAASGVLTLGLITLVGPLIRMYLGPGYGDVSWVARILVIGAIPYSLFLVLRNVIDAAHENAFTALILAAGFAVFCIGAGMSWVFSWGTLPIILSLLAGLIALGVLASRQTLRILRI